MFQLFRKEFDTEMRKFMAQVEADLSKKQSKLKLETCEEVDTLRQALRGIQDDTGNRNKALASISG
jgi:methionine synthase I (cobalamin-dependent)